MQVNINVPFVAPALKLGTTRVGQKLHIRVLTAASTIRIADSRDVLDIPQPFATAQGGYQINTADGLVEIQWPDNTDVYAEAIGVAAVAINFGID